MIDLRSQGSCDCREGLGPRAVLSFLNAGERHSADPGARRQLRLGQSSSLTAFPDAATQILTCLPGPSFYPRPVGRTQ